MPRYYAFTMKNKKTQGIQYTIRAVPAEVDQALRSNCARENRSLNEYVVETLKGGVGLSDSPHEFHDLDHLAGTWVADADCDKVLAEFDKVDEDMWQGRRP